MKFFRQFTGNQVGIDVERFAVLAYADGCNDRNAAALNQAFHQTGIDVGHCADLADVHAFLFRRVDQEFFRFDEVVVPAGNADGATAEGGNHGNDFFIDVSAQNHFHDVHGFAVGHAHALNKFSFFADFFQHLIDLRAAAMNDNGMQTDQFEQDDIACETFF